MRDRTLAALGVGALAALAGLVWLSHHPDSPALERATRWPVIGPAATAFRDLYRRPTPAVEPALEEAPIEVVRRTVEIPPPPASSRPRTPSPGSAPTPRRPAPRIDRTAIPPGPLPARTADRARLARAVELAGAAARRGRLGPYDLVTDFEPPPRWAEIASGLDSAFSRRTGRVPIGRPAETVVALVNEQAYRGLLRLEPKLRGIDAGGHASAGLAVVRVDPSDADAAEAVLVHELVHLVARRALGPALPVWLEEGLAEDLAQAPWDAVGGALRTSRLRGAVRRVGTRIEISGARAGLDLLVEAMGRGELPSLAQLVGMEWERFVGSEGPLRYAQALQLVRFLLDGGNPDHARGFRVYLERIAGGGGVDRAALEDALGEPLDAVEGPFRAWLAARREVEIRAEIDALSRPGERLVPSQSEASGSSSRQADEPSS